MGVQLNKVLIVIIKCLTKRKEAAAFFTYIFYSIAIKANVTYVSK